MPFDLFVFSLHSFGQSVIRFAENERFNNILFLTKPDLRICCSIQYFIHPHSSVYAVHLSIHPCIHPPTIHLSILQYSNQFIYPSTHKSVHSPTIHQYINQFICHPSIYPYAHHPSIHPHIIYQCINQFICRTIQPSMHP